MRMKCSRWVSQGMELSRGPAMQILQQNNMIPGSTWRRSTPERKWSLAAADVGRLITPDPWRAERDHVRKWLSGIPSPRWRTRVRMEGHRHLNKREAREATRWYQSRQGTHGKEQEGYGGCWRQKERNTPKHRTAPILWVVNRLVKWQWEMNWVTEDVSAHGEIRKENRRVREKAWCGNQSAKWTSSRQMKQDKKGK